MGDPKGRRIKVRHELVAVVRSRRRLQDRIADRITAFAGSMTFVYLHVAWFTGWIVLNVVGPWKFDPFPFGLLTLVVSLEAIFLSTFVMLSQNREAARSDIRAEIDFETNVLSEAWLEAVASKLGVDADEVQASARQRMADAKIRQERAVNQPG